MLYGCELWNNLTAKDLQRLHVFQHSVCKTAQTLPHRTRSDICESLFGLYPISSEIDKCKLRFFGRLCLLNYQTLPHRIFLTRLFSFLADLSKRQMGFIPDILKLLEKYNLTQFLQQWLDYGTFPNKQTWKTIVTQAVYQHHETLRTSRICGPDFSRFSAIFQDEDPSQFWRFPTNCYEISLCKFICKLISDPPYVNSNTCQLCGAVLHDFFTHVICSCSSTYAIRNTWWTEISNRFSVYLCSELCALPNDELYLILLGRRTNFPLGYSDDTTFKHLNFRLVQDAASHYYRAISQAIR